MGTEKGAKKVCRPAAQEVPRDPMSPAMATQVQRRPEMGRKPRTIYPKHDPQDRRSHVLPRRGPPVAVIRVPRWPRQEEECKRQPHGFAPRGTLWGGPERSAKETQLPHKKQPKVQARGRRKRDGDAKSPIIITIDESGEERNWGPLSKANAWRAG